MSKETDLLRPAAKLLRSALDRGFTFPHGAAECAAASLLALADQMERAVPVGWLESPYKTFARNHAYKMTAPQATSWRIPLYTHPAPEVTRDAERWKREAEALWLCVAECAQALRDGVVNIPKLRAALDNVQEPKP